MKRVLLGLLLGLSILAWIASRVEVGVVVSALAAASPALLLVTLIGVLVSLWLKGERWAAAIAAGANPRPRRRLFSAMLIGTAGNIALPARVGDFARALVLRRHNSVSVTRALVASWSSQALDFVVVALFLWLFAPASGFASRTALGSVVGIAIAVLVLLALVRSHPGWLRFLDRLPVRFRSRMAPLAGSALQGLAFLESPRVCLQVAGLTAAIWCVESATVLSGLRAFDLRVPYEAAPLLAAAFGLSFVLPLTPGSLGAIQLVSIYVLGAFGVEREQAFAFGLGYQAVAQVSLLVLGLAVLQREGLDWHRLEEGLAHDGASPGKVR